MAQRLPSLLRNRLWVPPAAIAVTLLATIFSGVLVPVWLNVPSPNWPEPLPPMAQRLPSLLRNRLWYFPAAIAVTLVVTIFSGTLT